MAGMAMQFINLGSLPDGVGGDTNRSANVKCNENFTELYKMSEVSGDEIDTLHKATKWLDGHKAGTGVNRDIAELVGLQKPLTIAQGGTGATHPLEACRGINALALGQANDSYNTELKNGVMPAIAHIGDHPRMLTLYNAGNQSASAVMTFHRGGQFACHFGLDTDNQLKVGGWSFGARAYRLYHEGNTIRAADGTLKAI